MNLLVTNFNNTGEDVMVFTEEPMSSVTLGMALAYKDQTFCEIYPVKDEEVQFYIYDPLWLTKETAANTRSLADKFTECFGGSKRHQDVLSRCGQ